jgi:hypothetical protein
MTDLITDDPLSVEEQSQLVHHEAVIRRGRQTFVDVGASLVAIRDLGLYRETHKTFEAYVQDRWEFSVRHAHHQMSASSVVRLLEANNCSLLPANEARPLTRLEAEHVGDVWAEDDEPEVSEPDDEPTTYTEPFEDDPKRRAAFDALRDLAEEALDSVLEDIDAAVEIELGKYIEARGRNVQAMGRVRLAKGGIMNG